MNEFKFFTNASTAVATLICPFTLATDGQDYRALANQIDCTGSFDAEHERSIALRVIYESMEPRTMAREEADFYKELLASDFEPETAALLPIWNR